MARPLRIEYAGALYHITARGNERKDIYYADNDYLMFLHVFEKVIKEYNWICHSYCLMNNHYHLLIETVDPNLSLGMRQLNGVYTQKFNKIHHRVGHLFQGRFKAILVEKQSYLLELCRYIVLNPVRAKITDDPKNYKWSSYRSTIGLENKLNFLTTDWILKQFSENFLAAQEAYKKFVFAGIKIQSPLADAKGQLFLGSDEFSSEIESFLNSKDLTLEITKKQRYATRPDLSNVVSQKTMVSKSQRNIQIVKCHFEYGYTITEISHAFQLHYTTISNVLKKCKTL